MTEVPLVVVQAVQIVSELLDGKVRRAKVCGCGPCKNEAQSFADWLAGQPRPAPPLRETWWK